MEIIVAIILLFLFLNFINEIIKFLFYLLLYIFYPVLWLINKIIILFKQIYSNIISKKMTQNLKSSNNKEISNNDNNNNITNSIKINDNKEYDENYQAKYNFDKIKEIRDDFNKCLYIANQQKTKEILEVLIEFDDLDKAYSKAKKVDSNFMDRHAYDETKLNILDDIINDKFRKCSSNQKKKIECMKSLLDELYVCKRRYPEYKDVFEKHITNINNFL